MKKYMKSIDEAREEILGCIKKAKYDEIIEEHNFYPLVVELWDNRTDELLDLGNNSFISSRQFIYTHKVNELEKAISSLKEDVLKYMIHDIKFSKPMKTYDGTCFHLQMAGITHMLRVNKKIPNKLYLWVNDYHTLVNDYGYEELAFFIYYVLR